MNFSEVAERWKSIDMDVMFLNAVEDKEPMLLDMLRSQLREGLGGRGRLRRYSESSMSSYGRNGYKSYGEYKNARNPKPGLGIPDLFDTGDFYQGFFANVIGNGKTQFIEAWSNDDKTDVIVGGADNYAPFGAEIFELHPKNMKEYSRTVILPQIVNQIKIHLSLK